MRPYRIIGTAALFLLLGTTVPAWAEQGKQNEGQGKSDKQADKRAKDTSKGNAKAEKQQNKGQEQQDQKAESQAKKEEHQQGKQHARDQKQAGKLHPVQQPDNRPPGWDKGKKVGWDGGTVPPGHQARLPRERQRVLITEHRTRRLEYSRYLDQQRARQREWAAQLQQQRRMTYYRYQQDYWSRLRRQQLALRRNYNYNRDPYFYTAPSYSYSYGNNSFQTNEYGANLLRQAVNNGYAEGYRAGQADRQDRFGGGYQNSYAYQDANLGYNGMYVNQGDYNYYFREGFNRGYQDGYNNQMQYGQYSNGNRSILGTILSTVLNLQSLR